MIGRGYFDAFASQPFVGILIGITDGILSQTSAVAISEIVLANITGTSSSSTAVKIKCSDYVPCRNIVLQNIAVRKGPDQNESNAHFSCWNAYGFVSNITNPMSCALQPQPNLVDSSRPYQIPQGC
jgi:hypothetical protein